MSKQDKSDFSQGDAHRNVSRASRTDDVISTASAMAGNAANKAKDIASDAAGIV